MMVPNGWENKSLESLCDVDAPITYGVLKPGDYVPNGVPLLQIKDLLGDLSNLDTLHRISPELDHEYRRSRIATNDILISLVGTVGRIGLVPSELDGTNIHRNLGRIRTKNYEFLIHYLNSDLAKNRIGLSSSGSSQSALNLSVLRALKVPVPPLPEQRKIAKILSTWDKAISTTERLIDNSKQQKKALMQQLLTGKKRLLDDSGKPFEGEWEEVRLDDIAKYQKGYTYKSNEYSESATSNGFLTLKSIQRGGGYSASGIKYLLKSVDEKFTVKTGDVVFAVTDLTRNAEVVGAPIFIPNLPFEKTYISMDLVKLRLNSSVNKQFIYYLLKTPCNRNFMRARASGSTVLHLDVQGSKKLKLFIPKLIEEQKKIATVLTNADKEIELLEQQLADLKQEKKALMQQLLTGKRRVKIDDKEVA